MTDFVSDLEIDLESLRVRSRETSRREFKERYDKVNLARYARTLAAFANAEGGCLIFGVASKPRTLVGCDTDSIPDEAEITTKLQNWFDPCPDFEVLESEVAGMNVVAIHVFQARSRPIIAKCTVTVGSDAVMREGQIYFRYSGKTQVIRFAELQAILRERDQKVIETLMSSLTAIRRIGVDKVGFVNREGAQESSGPTKMYIPKDAVSSLNLIDRGRFAETEDEGDRAYVVVGEVNLGFVEPVVVDDEDRIRPGDMAGRLTDICKTLLHADVRLTQNHLASFARSRGVKPESGTASFNNRYCKFDDKSKLWFYREAFVELLTRAVTEDPVQTANELGLARALRLKIEQHRLETLEREGSLVANAPSET